MKLLLTPSADVVPWKDDVGSSCQAEKVVIRRPALATNRKKWYVREFKFSRFSICSCTKASPRRPKLQQAHTWHAAVELEMTTDTDWCVAVVARLERQTTVGVVDCSVTCSTTVDEAQLCSRKVVGIRKTRDRICRCRLCVSSFVCHPLSCLTRSSWPSSTGVELGCHSTLAY